MKTLFLTIGLATILGLGAFYLYAGPQLRQARPPQAPSPAVTSVPADVSRWNTYHNSVLGFSIDYPNDGTFTASVDVNQGKLPNSTLSGVEPAPVIGSLVAICQSPLLFTPNTIANEECFQIYVTPDPHILTSLPASLQISGSELIHGNLFDTLSVNPEVFSAKPFLHDYAYAIEHNGRYYVFQSSGRPDDATFEQMMVSLKFD